VTVQDSLHSLLDYECFLFCCDEWQMKNPCSLNHWTPLRMNYNWINQSQSESESQSYFTIDGLPVRLVVKLLGPTPIDFFQLNSCGNSPYITSSLTRWFVSYEYAWPFVKCIFRTYSMLLKIIPFALHTSPLSVQALQGRSRLAYVSYGHYNHRKIDWAHSAASKCHLHSLLWFWAANDF
jgi:hypothetical protein